METWVSYTNGNYTVRLNTKNGTKIRENNLDFFEPSTVESMDLKITNCCDMGCPMCHENSYPDGKHADLFAPSFLDTLHPYTEIAIGGGNPLSHPNLLKFLLKCKEKQWIPSMTVNQIHFEKNFEFIKQLADSELIYGLGISLVSVTPQFIDKVKQIPNAVIHVIAGIVHEFQLTQLKDNNLKILILGYKLVRRGKDNYVQNGRHITENHNELRDMLPRMLKDKWFQVVSFDNLALNQLDVKHLLSEEDWNRFYMGDDGIDGSMTSASMFIDLVERKYSKNSCDLNRYDLKSTIEEMYGHLRGDSFYDDLRLEQMEQM